MCPKRAWDTSCYLLSDRRDESMMTIKIKGDCSDDDDDDHEGKKGRDAKGSEAAPPTLPRSNPDPQQSLSSNGAQLKEQQHLNAPEQPTASAVSELTVRLVNCWLHGKH